MTRSPHQRYTPVAIFPGFQLGWRPATPGFAALRLAKPNVNVHQQNGVCEVKLRMGPQRLRALAEAWRDFGAKIHGFQDAPELAIDNAACHSNLHREGDDCYWTLSGAMASLTATGPWGTIGFFPECLELLAPVAVMDAFAQRALALVSPESESQSAEHD